MDARGLSVDYGTSHTVAVLSWPDGRTRPLLFDASPLLPSAVCADAAGGLLVGREALAAAQRDPGRFEPYPKRQVDAREVLLGDRQVPVVELISAVLRRVAEEALRVAGGPAAEVVLTFPVGWGPTRRGVLRSAAEAVGWSSPTMVPEPVAAAGYFLEVVAPSVPLGAPLVVYDLGGGTFDVSVVRRTGEGFEIVASDGLPDLGGVDLDALVVQLVGESVASLDPSSWSRLTGPTGAADRRHFRALWDSARTAKEILSRSPVATVAVPGVDREVQVTREEFDRAAAPVLALTTDLTQAMLRRAALAAADLAGIFLVGGATRTPLVATLLHRAIGLPPTVLDPPVLVVAEGAVRIARMPYPVTSPGQPPRPARRPPPYVSTGTPGRFETGAPPAPSPYPSAGKRRRGLVVGLIVAAAVLLGAGIPVAVLAVSQWRADTQLQPVAGLWHIASIGGPGWTSVSTSATMKIDANGTVTVTDTTPSYGCTGTIESAGDHKPYRISLGPKCDTENPSATSVLAATLDSTGDELITTVDTGRTMVGSGQPVRVSARWTREP